MYVHLLVTHYDKRHRLISGHIEQSRSFVKAFLQLLYCETASLTQNIIDITNTSRGITNTSVYFPSFDVTHPGLSSSDDFVTMPATISNYSWRPSLTFADEKGIIVGTSSTAVAVADDNLVAPIANGTSAGQFVYYGCWGLNYTTGASSASFDVERIFKNSSGGSIVVAEIGMYAGWGSITGGGGESGGEDETTFCIIRDVLGATVTVLNGEYLKVKYTITVSN